MRIQRLYGRRSVLEALRSGARVQKLFMARSGHGPILDELRRAAEERGVAIEWVDPRRLEKVAGAGVHQGVAALVAGTDYADLGEIVSAAQADLAGALVVAADEIEDPRNLGAIARCAEGAGAQGLIIPKHRSAEITEVAAKASGGAVEHLRVAQVTNLAHSLREFKEAGLWIAGLDLEASQDLWEADLRRPLVLVVGSEGKGIRPLTRDHCDLRLRIPMRGKVASLNVAVAAGIALFEIRRQQRMPPAPVSGYLHQDPLV